MLLYLYFQPISRESPNNKLFVPAVVPTFLIVRRFLFLVHCPYMCYMHSIYLPHIHISLSIFIIRPQPITIIRPSLKVGLYRNANPVDTKIVGEVKRNINRLLTSKTEVWI